MNKISENKINLSNDRKRISKPLLELSIGQTIEFTIRQIDSVNGIIQRLQKRHRQEGYRWATSTKDLTISVTRTA